MIESGGRQMIKFDNDKNAIINPWDFFYAADNMDSEEWDARSVSNFDKIEEKDRVAMIALELATRI